MNAQALRELLSPPEAGDRPSAGSGVDDLAQALLQRLVREAQSDGAPPSEERLSAEAEQALYAWGVMCYEKGRHRDAAALFTALLRRCAASARLYIALGAAHLGCGEPARAADVYARAHALDPTDAELVFHWAQARWQCGCAEDARQLLHKVRELSTAAVDRWPELAHWCTELHDRMETASSAQSCPPT